MFNCQTVPVRHPMAVTPTVERDLALDQATTGTQNQLLPRDAFQPSFKTFLERASAPRPKAVAGRASFASSYQTAASASSMTNSATWRSVTKRTSQLRMRKGSSSPIPCLHGFLLYLSSSQIEAGPRAPLTVSIGSPAVYPSSSPLLVPFPPFADTQGQRTTRQDPPLSGFGSPFSTPFSFSATVRRVLLSRLLVQVCFALVFAIHQWYQNLFSSCARHDSRA